MQYKNPGTIKFIAKFETEGVGSFVYFPFSVEEKFGVKGRIPVKATFNGEPYTGSMVKYGDPRHMLLILKSIREKLNLKEGDMVDVTVELDETERKIELPKEAMDLLKKHPEELKYFNTLSFTHQREYFKWITEAKQEETKLRRIEKMILMLKSKKVIS